MSKWVGSNQTSRASTKKKQTHVDAYVMTVPDQGAYKET